MLRELELLAIATEQPLGSAEISANLVLQSTVSKELIRRRNILASRQPQDPYRFTAIKLWIFSIHFALPIILFTDIVSGILSVNWYSEA